MNFENSFIEATTLEEQLNLFTHNLYYDSKDISLDQLLSTPIPTYQPPTPTSPTSSTSSYGSPPPAESFFNDIIIPVKKKYTKKVLPPGQSTLPIRVTHKTSRAPKHLQCFNCKVTKTPLWRRTPDRTQTLCNACGLYYKQYNQHRPLHVRHKPSLVNNSNKSIAPHPYNNFVINLNQPSPSPPSPSLPTDEPLVECINCQQTKTPLWRKNEHGEPICNACGLYAKLHNKNRPVEMRKSTIQRRRRDWGIEANEYISVVEPATSTFENDKFASMLLEMDRHQIEGFLGMLEQKCDLLRTVLE